MQLTEEQRARIMRLEDTLAKSSSSGEAAVIGPAIAARFFEALHALLAAHNAGAQEPVGTAVNDEELGRFWEMHKPASEFPVGTHVYAYPRSMTNAARDAARYQWLRHRVSAHGIVDGYAFAFPTHRTLPASQECMRGSVAQHLDAAIDAEIERLERAKGDNDE